MKKLILKFGILLFFLPSPAQASITANEMMEALDQTDEVLGKKSRSPTQIDFFLTSTFSGAATAISWANLKNEHNGWPKHYCPPKKLAISPQQYKSIFRDYLKKYPENGKFPYQLIIIESLANVFPCN